jgi:hypothetical protein
MLSMTVITVRICSPLIKRSVDRLLELLTNMRMALETGGFQMISQFVLAIYRMRTMTVCTGGTTRTTCNRVTSMQTDVIRCVLGGSAAMRCVQGIVTIGAGGVDASRR